MRNFFILLALVTFFGCAPSQYQINTPDLKGESEVTNIAGMNFVYLKPGTFLMGIPAGYKGAIGGKNPRHQVTISKGFYLQVTEVTQEQWYLVTGSNPSYFQECGRNCPVEQVSWDDAQDFLFLLNTLDDNYSYRLPTEAEWEYAARAGSNGPYFFGDCLTTFHANFHQSYSRQASKCQCPNGQSFGRTIPVATLEKNAWGLYDMHGNVAEWCQDYFGERPELHVHVVDPKGPEKGYARVVRGGSWDSSSTACLSGYSNRAPQYNRSRYTGFRVVMMPKEKTDQ